MSLALTFLQLSHFRSHRLARVSVDARPVAIYGANGSGKTNLLEAVSLFSPGRGLRRASAADMARRPEALGWKISGHLSSQGKIHEIDFTSEGRAARQVRVDGKPTSQTALGQLSRVLWLVPAMDRLWIEGAEGRRRFLDRLTLSFSPAHADLSLAYDKAMRERNRLLREQVNDPAWYSALERQMAEAGVRITEGRRTAIDQIRAAQADAETQFPAATLELIHPDTALPETAEDLQDALAQTRPRDIAAGRSLIGPHRADLIGTYTAKNVPARDCSTGEQKALLISLVLANARALARDQGEAPLLLLDEVAAHLDAARRAALYDEICALKAQAWMTGTGPELFTDLGSRAQYIEVSETGGLSEVVQKEAP